MGEREITIEIKRPEVFILIGILSIVLILELQVTIPSPIAFGDEGFHTRLAQYIAEEKEIPVWIPFWGTELIRSGYSRPPLWNLLEGGFYLVFGFSELIPKILTPLISSILIGLSVFLLGKKIYNKEVGFIGSIMSVTIPSIVTYAILFYTDTLFTFYFVLFILTFTLAIKSEKDKYWILAGIFGSFAFLTKSPGTTVFVLIFLGFVYQLYKKGNAYKLLKKYITLILLVGIIIGTFFLKNYVFFNTPFCDLDLPFFDNSGCIKRYEYKSEIESTGRYEPDIFESGFVNYINFAYGSNQIGFVVLPFVFVGFLCGLIIIGSRKEIPDIIILLSIISFIPVFYRSFGRGEDAARFTLGMAPIICLIAANYFERIYDFIKKYHKLLILVFVGLIIFFSYQNLSQKLVGARSYDKDSGQYIGFKMFSPSFFKGTDFIKRNVSEDALIATVWDYATVYNSQRNVVGLRGMPDEGDIVLSNDLNLSLSRLEVNGVTHIFVQKFSINAQHYPPEFVQLLENNPSSFVKIYETGPIVEDCIKAGGCDGVIVYKISY